jgi:peptidase E
VNQLNLIVMEKTVEEIARRKAKSALEERIGNHDFIGIGGGNVFILYWPPLEYSVSGEKVIVDELEELALINGRGFEHLWV